MKGALFSLIVCLSILSHSSDNRSFVKLNSWSLILTNMLARVVHKKMSDFNTRVACFANET
jgi:hypothetical protein